MAEGVVQKLRPAPKSAIEPSYAAKAEAVPWASQPDPIAGPTPIHADGRIDLDRPNHDGNAAPAATPPDAEPTTVAAPQPPPASETWAEPATAHGAKPHRGGRWFPALCAGVALLGAVVALAAPWLRPQLDTQARKWLGPDNPVSHLVSPAVVATALPDPAVTQEMLRASLAGYDARIRGPARGRRRHGLAVGDAE